MARIPWYDMCKPSPEINHTASPNGALCENLETIDRISRHALSGEPAKNLKKLAMESYQELRPDSIREERLKNFREQNLAIAAMYLEEHAANPDKELPAGFASEEYASFVRAYQANGLSVGRGTDADLFAARHLEEQSGQGGVV